MTHPTSQRAPRDLVIRTYRVEDQPRVSQLYAKGLLVGQILPNDTGVDIDDIPQAYLADRASHFWVAEVRDEVVGMIGVARDTQHTAEIRRLRVDKAWQDKPIAARLIETALKHCRQHGYLKVVLDTRFERAAAVDLFERFGFQSTAPARSGPAAGRDEPLEFYLDLYRQPDPHRP
jgi:ribosomal protein S18 acetylase RimI-like enzyme